MKQRYIPFGYRLSGGSLTAHEMEAEIFCWEQDYCSDTSYEDDAHDFDLDDISDPKDTLEKETDIEKYPTWSVSIKYTDGTGQNICGTDDYLPDKVGELYQALAELFAPEEDPDWLEDDLNDESLENRD